MSLKIVPTPEFNKQVKKLSKNYKMIIDDLETLKKELLENPASGVSLGNSCYKIRIPNSSIPTGKSGGFRVITYYFDSKDIVRLLLIYSKTQFESVSDKEINDVISRNMLSD
jgi:mRNA-degrading endonuclease RelE of RelBE toxin-antitoxin system